MSEHITAMCERILSEAHETPVTPLDDVALTVRMRERIQRWYNDRTCLAGQAKRMWERQGALQAEVDRLRPERNARQKDWEIAETARVNLQAEVEQLKVTLDGAKKMACDACSSGVSLQADGYHRCSDGSLQWCDARIDAEPTEDE